MHCEVFKGLLITSHLFFVTNAVGIDGKLDFGSSHASMSSLRSENNNKNTFKFSKTIQSGNDFENIGVVCTSGGCNTTDTTSDSRGDTLQADILVHVHAKVDSKHNQTASVEDTPDVPIVVGYGGLSNNDEENSRSSGPQSIFVPSVPESPTYKSTSTFGSKFNPSSSFTPSIGSRIDSLSGTFDSLDSLGRTGTFYMNSPPVDARIDGFGGSFDGLNPSTKPISGFYVTKSSPVGSRIDYVSRSFEKLDPEAKLGIYPSASIDTTEDKFKENGIEIKIPYFETSYHNHYYGENPPPQFVWHSKKTNGFNPVEFKTIKSTWMPLWNRKVGPHRHGIHGNPAGQGEVKCTCKEEQQGTSTGLRWYPSAERRMPSFNDPGSQINDKLAPLN